MGKLIEEYKRKKAMIGKPSTMFIIESRPEGVLLHKREILSIEENDYKMGSFPFEITLKNEKDIHEKSGYGSGFGDLWGWSYFSTLDEEQAAKLFLDESKRVYDKYIDPSRPPEPEIIMPTG
jgi:hypothetical protein